MSTAVPALQLDLFAGWQAAQTATIAAALIAVLGVMTTILTTSARARREHKTDLYAQALGGVADYLEGPYRIRRKDGTSAHRNAITAALSDIKSAIDHSQELLRLHAPDAVADAYDDYVHAANLEAGRQMRHAWELPPIGADADVNLGVGYDRTASATYRTQVLKLMQADLARRTGNPWRFVVYRRCAGHILPKPYAAPEPISESVSVTETGEKDTPTRR